MQQRYTQQVTEENSGDTCAMKPNQHKKRKEG